MTNQGEENNQREGLETPYHKTKDIVHVQRKMGHRSIRNTFIYRDLVDFENAEYISRAVRNIHEACKLIESGFEYVTEIDGLKLFRKRK